MMKTPLILACLFLAALLGCQEGKKPVEAAQDQAPPTAPQPSAVYVDRSTCYDFIFHYGCEWEGYSPEEKKKLQAEFEKGTALSITHLGKADLRYQMIELDPKKLPSRREPNREGMPTSNPRITLTLDSELGVSLVGFEKYGYGGIAQDSLSDYMPYSNDLILLKIGTLSYCLDSLYHGKDFQPSYDSLQSEEVLFSRLNSWYLPFCIRSIYKFDFGDKRYIILYVEMAVGLLHINSYPKPVLIEFLTDGSHRLYGWHGEIQSTDSPFRFNDFDGDGKLDYLWANEHSSGMPGSSGKARLYSLSEGNYVLRKEDYFAYMLDSISVPRIKPAIAR